MTGPIKGTNLPKSFERLNTVFARGPKDFINLAVPFAASAAEAAPVDCNFPILKPLEAALPSPFPPPNNLPKTFVIAFDESPPTRPAACKVIKVVINEDAAFAASANLFPNPSVSPPRVEKVPLKPNDIVCNNKIFPNAPSVADEKFSALFAALSNDLLASPFAKLGMNPLAAESEGILPVGSSLVLVTARPIGFLELRSFPL